MRRKGPCCAPRCSSSAARVGGEDIAVSALIDRALYRAKSLGGNRVVVHHGEPAALDREGFAALSNRFDYSSR